MQQIAIAREPWQKEHARANLGVACAPHNCIVCCLRASEVYAVHGWVVTQVLAFFAATVHKGQVTLIHERLEGSPAAVQRCSQPDSHRMLAPVQYRQQLKDSQGTDWVDVKMLASVLCRQQPRDRDWVDIRDINGIAIAATVCVPFFNAYWRPEQRKEPQGALLH